MSACVCMYVRESVCYRGVIVVTADEVLAFCDHASCQPWTWGLGAQGWSHCGSTSFHMPQALWPLWALGHKTIVKMIVNCVHIKMNNL